MNRCTQNSSDFGCSLIACSYNEQISSAAENQWQEQTRQSIPICQNQEKCPFSLHHDIVYIPKTFGHRHLIKIWSTLLRSSIRAGIFPWKSSHSLWHVGFLTSSFLGRKVLALHCLIGSRLHLPCAACCHGNCKRQHSDHWSTRQTQVEKTAYYLCSANASLSHTMSSWFSPTGQSSCRGLGFVSRPCQSLGWFSKN